MHPHPGPGLTSVSASYDSAHGAIISTWSVQNNQFKWDVAIPANTTATIWVPTTATSSVKEGGKPAATSQGVTPLRIEAGFAVYEVASGSYEFTAAQ